MSRFLEVLARSVARGAALSLPAHGPVDDPSVQRSSSIASTDNMDAVDTRSCGLLAGASPLRPHDPRLRILPVGPLVGLTSPGLECECLYSPTVEGTAFCDILSGYDDACASGRVLEFVDALRLGRPASPYAAFGDVAEFRSLMAGCSVAQSPKSASSHTSMARPLVRCPTIGPENLPDRI